VVRLKSPTDIKHLAAGGAILADVLDQLSAQTLAGVLPTELDNLARELLATRRCQPAFLNYSPRGQEPFPAALCVSVNDAVVHGFPSDTPFQAGDLVGLDLGLIYMDKYYLDSARTVVVGSATPDNQKLIEITQESLRRGIAAAQLKNTTGDIGAAIQQYVEGEGYSVVRQLVGHGVDFAVHEAPPVPNYGQAGTGHKLKEGLVIAIEPMVTSGDPAITTAPDHWTVCIASGQIAAHFEHTIAITKAGPIILTKK